VCSKPHKVVQDELFEVTRVGFFEQLQRYTDEAYFIRLDARAQKQFGALLDCLIYELKIDNKLDTF